MTTSDRILQPSDLRRSGWRNQHHEPSPPTVPATPDAFARIGGELEDLYAVRQKRIRDRDLLFVDVETTGLEPDEGAEIVELAFVRTTHNLHLKERYVAKVMPRHIETATAQALAINGFDGGVWEREAVDLDVAMGRFIDATRGGVVLVNQGIAFDWKFLRAALIESGSLDLAEVNRHIVDVANFAWHLVLEERIDNVKLETVCAHFGITNDGQHRAMVDVERAIQVYARHMFGRRMQDVMASAIRGQK